MFDFAFSELMVICVVALVVLGPTRLPGVVRKVGRWIGKARAMARDFRQQLESEVTLDELNRMTERQTRAAAATPEPDAPAAPGSENAASAADAGTAASDAAAVTDPMAASGYPYGMPTDTSAMSSSSMASSADPATVIDPSDDTFSHAHAADAPPEAWSPEADSPPPEDPVTTANGTDSEPAGSRRA